MRLSEYQAYEIFSDYGIPIAKGRVANNPQEAAKITEELRGPVTIKIQVPVGGRGKGGGIKFASTPQEAYSLTKEMLNSRFKGKVVKKIFVQEKVDINKEYYLGVTLAREKKKAVVMTAVSGGVEIERTAKINPQSIFKEYVHPEIGFRDYQVRKLTLAIGKGEKRLIVKTSAVLKSLYKLFEEKDCYLAEINPWALTREGKLLALDAKIILDDNALYRHSEFTFFQEREGEGILEARARNKGLSYLKFKGNIGCIVNGAGLAMATLDLIKTYKMEPANFLDIGGGAKSDKVKEALDIVFSDKRIKGILVNIFGGITRCDLVAKGLKKSILEHQRNIPLVIRLSGTAKKEGRKELENIPGVILTDTMDEAAKRLMEMSKK